METSEEISGLIRLWNDTVFDRIGFDVLLLEDVGESDDDDDDDDDPGEHDANLAGPVCTVSVVSRFDIAIVDSAELLAAGRTAYMAEYETDGPEDAHSAIETEVDALRAVANDIGMPWWHVPGADVERGTVAYFTDNPDGDGPIDGDALAEISPPSGFPAFVEGYTAV